MSALVLAISAVFLQLTFRDVIAGIPHDTGAVVVYIIFAAFLYGVWRGSRGRGGKEAASTTVGPAKSQSPESSSERA